MAAQGHLAILGDRDALVWVLTAHRLAFPEPRYPGVSPRAIKKGDTVFLYTTRGCYRNPSRDRGRVIAETTAASDVGQLTDPPTFGDRSFPLGCRFSIQTLAPAREGADLRELAPQMSSFPIPERWSVYLRRSVLALSPEDVALLRQQMARFDNADLKGRVQTYVAQATPRKRSAAS